MAPGLLPDLEMHATQPLSSGEDAQLDHLNRLAASTAREERQEPSQRLDSARLDQIEKALTILAAVVARLAKSAQPPKSQVRAPEHEINLQEERRIQRELVRSIEARLHLIEERLDRQAPQPAYSLENTEAEEQLATSLASIRASLAALNQRRSRTG